jgi:hypothetical protein
LVVVIAMTQYERVRGNYRRALVHFEGLVRMVELRGGITQFKATAPTIAQKVFR